MTGEFWAKPPPPLPVHGRDDLEPSVPESPASIEASLHSIAISLKRIADALTPADGASSCELVQQISEMLQSHREHPFGHRR